MHWGRTKKRIYTSLYVEFFIEVNKSKNNICLKFKNGEIDANCRVFKIADPNFFV